METDASINTTESPVGEFAVTGMNCQSCVRHVTEAIQGVAAVAGVHVALETNRASVRWKPAARPDPALVIEAVEHAGYGAKLISPEEDHHGSTAGSPRAEWRFTLIFGGMLTAPLVIGEWVFGLGMKPWFQWVGLAFAAPVMVVCGGRFFRGAWQQLRRGSSNMDTLVALGSSTAFGYSATALFLNGHGHTYFMEAAAIITLISAGHYVETLVSARAADALRTLMSLAPQTARVLGAGDAETEVPVAAVRSGDRVVLKPGDRAPLDGEVIAGGSAVDESMLTGESLPVEKSAGDRVYAGTANQDGRLVIRVTATGNDTALAQIIAAVQRAQSSRADIQKLGDRVSSVFVPIVVVIALATGLWWGLAYEQALRVGEGLASWLWPVSFPGTALAAAFVHAAGVLIVACPCAMGLATPVAIMAGANAAASRGILIRDGVALEKSGAISAVMFDKTGTLTRGKLTVAALEDLREESSRAEPITRLAAALASPSSHPLSKAVAESDKGAPTTDRPRLENWRELRGCGVQADSLQGTLRLGSLSWLSETGVDLARADEFVNRWSVTGGSILGLALNGRLLALLALRDEIKPHASEVVARLTREGKKVYLITGDNHQTAATLAGQAGIAANNVFAEIRPEQKAAMVKTLQLRGERVAFVGDGINDAPALEQSDLGVAVAKASDVAREAADIILLKTDIQAIPEALGLARATLRTIKQNLFWAFFYNAAAIPLAVLGFLSPVVCALAMGFSDLIVIGNALRLRRWRSNQ